MRFFVCLFVCVYFSGSFLEEVAGFLCAGEAIILGFQHYFTMLGTTVLIPSLVILNINGHSVCSSGETRTDRHRKERFRKVLIFVLVLSLPWNARQEALLCYCFVVVCFLRTLW
jgi:hypothetical protein